LNGMIKTDFGSTLELAYGVAIQPDDKIIAVGSGNGSVALARYQPDGILDSSFGVTGKVITPFGSMFSQATAVVLQPDGKIVVAAAVAEVFNDFVVIRYNLNGGFDSSFGTNGITITKLTAGEDFPSSVLLQKDGKIILAGTADSDFALVRYNRNGTLDKSFGVNGIVTKKGDNVYAAFAALQKDGKIVLLGTQYHDDTLYALIARYKANGKIDQSFYNNGTRVIRSDSWQAYNALAIQPDNKILLAGLVDNGVTATDFIINRLNQDGSFDKSFGTGGRVTTDFKTKHTAEAINAIAIQPDGKIVAVGYIGLHSGFYSAFAIARYNGDDCSVGRANIVSNSTKQDRTPLMIILSPNPVKDDLRLTGLSASLKTISIIDLKGNLLQQIETAATSYSFNTNQLSAGMYLIKIDEDGRFVTLKFMKQ